MPLGAFEESDPRALNHRWKEWDTSKGNARCVVGWRDILSLMSDRGWELVAAVALADESAPNLMRGVVREYELFFKRPKP